MKKHIKILTISLIAFCLGITAGNYAMSTTFPQMKVAVVNVPKLIESSATVKTLKEQNTKNFQELAKFSETAQVAVSKETDTKKQKALKEKYQKEFQTKRAAMTKTYEAKLMEIDKQISAHIESYAKTEGFDLVLAQGAVLYGGNDITDAIIKQVK